MLTLLNHHVLGPLLARKRGSRAYDYLRLLERTQWDAPETIRLRQWAMLKAMVEHAYATVPLYRERFDAVGLHPSDIRTPADYANVPVLTKADIRAAGDRLISSAYQKSELRRKTTSGSTGVSLAVYVDEPSMQWKHACTMRSDQWSGWRLGERCAKVWGNPDYLREGWKGRLVNRFVERAVYLDTLHVTDETLRDFCATLRRYPVSLLFGHAHSLYLLACYAKRERIEWVRPKGIIATAMLLHDYQRAAIEVAFGTQVTNRYGCEEVSLIASECPAHDGMHFNADSIFPEILADRPGAGPGAGSLVLTDLTNFGMPLLRYQVGDVVVGQSGACPCGRGLPRIARVEGREADYVLTPAGRLISGISLTENFAMHIPGAAQVQVVQEKLTFLRVRMVAGDDWGDGSHRAVGALVADLFGPTMRHEVELVERIPQEASGKYRFCISPVASEHLRAMSA